MTFGQRLANQPQRASVRFLPTEPDASALRLMDLSCYQSAIPLDKSELREINELEDPPRTSFRLAAACARTARTMPSWCASRRITDSAPRTKASQLVRSWHLPRLPL